MNQKYRQSWIAFALVLVLSFVTNSLLAQKQLTIQSSHVPENDTVWVFTPEDYSQTQKSFPAVYLLHGYSGSYKQWNNIIDLQSMANRIGFVIITPDGLYDSWYLNSPVKEDSQYEDFFFRDLMPKINQQYRINTDQVFISGLSMGGHGALYLFSQNPDLFKSAGSVSGVMDLTGAAGKYGLSALLGNMETNTGRWQEFSVTGNLKAIASSGKKIILSCGWDDPFFEMNQSLVLKADSLAIDATFISQPGAHNYDYWKKSLPLHLFFFSEQLKEKKH